MRCNSPFWAVRTELISANSNPGIARIVLAISTQIIPLLTFALLNSSLFAGGARHRRKTGTAQAPCPARITRARLVYDADQSLCAFVRPP
ncbi:hypothetical protein [Burkholderia pseudomallei]|uniref:hypothetical protein n=1 Tax=Burkholderia pseudomallei TaxID=28450 RepID=UPI00016AB9B1|nr:hypothetical protein [Burkholderia pseudomallei]MVZ87238.1 hypothetical protein [Burkholderia pseudomallei]MWA18221.1 hypothetical protein [Burkholderia pseudomallei]MWA27168.1 hypothetical protein [Burkholderia pseudomallei]MWJ59832.1 hypothetical protein [Burkholderia pseudomallei]QBP56477.1 hypothetical protein E2R23_15885 [Burkholderia pseudomallei]